MAIRERMDIVCLLAVGAWLAWEAVTWPDVKALATQAPATTAFIDNETTPESPEQVVRAEMLPAVRGEGRRLADASRGLS